MNKNLTQEIYSGEHNSIENANVKQENKITDLSNNNLTDEVLKELEKVDNKELLNKVKNTILEAKNSLTSLEELNKEIIKDVEPKYLGEFGEMTLNNFINRIVESNISLEPLTLTIQPLKLISAGLLYKTVVNVYTKRASAFYKGKQAGINNQFIGYNNRLEAIKFRHRQFARSFFMLTAAPIFTTRALAFLMTSSDYTISNAFN